MFAYVIAHYLSRASDENLSSNNLGVAIDVYESSPEFQTVGAGIMVWSRTYEILKEVGLGDVLTELAAGRGAYEIFVS